MDRCGERELDADDQTRYGGDGFGETRVSREVPARDRVFDAAEERDAGSSRTMTDVTVSDTSVCGWNTATVAATATATMPAMSWVKNSGQPMRVRGTVQVRAYFGQFAD